MKLLLVLMSAVALSAAYSTENDNLDIDALVNDKDALRSYLKCFTDQGPCDEVQSSFKKDVPEALKEACAKCNPTQKHILRLFLAALKEKLTDEYNQMKKALDPQGQYFDNLEAAVANA